MTPHTKLSKQVLPLWSSFRPEISSDPPALVKLLTLFDCGPTSYLIKLSNWLKGCTRACWNVLDLNLQATAIAVSASQCRVIGPDLIEQAWFCLYSFQMY